MEPALLVSLPSMGPAQVKSSPFASRRESYCHAGGARVLRPILLICLTAQSSVAQITTRQLPLAGMNTMDAAGNLFFAGAGGIRPTPGAAQVQPGGGTCTISTPFGGMIQAPCLDAYVEKLDATGNVVFATLLGGPTNDLASAVAIDSAANVYVAGSTGGQFPTTRECRVAGRHHQSLVCRQG